MHEHKKHQKNKIENKKYAIEKTNQEWQEQLTPEQHRITRKKGTERAFSGPYWDEKAKGIYKCICCDTPLFHSNAKFDSGTGWPSFFQALNQQALEERQDRSFFMHRTESLCAICGAHLGHIFPDGPKPTGLRYCINGNALRFEKTDKAK